MAYSFLDLAYDVLRQTAQPLTYQEVWETGKASGLAAKIKTSGKTPWQSLGAQLYVEVRDNPQSKFIQMDLQDIDSSSVLYPARIREGLDWETINKLCEQNTDFEKFIQDVKIDFESKRFYRSEYDEIPKDPVKYLSE